MIKKVFKIFVFISIYNTFCPIKSVGEQGQFVKCQNRPEPESTELLKTQSNAKIVVLGNNSTSKESELAHDILSIITVFSARMHGLRKYKSQIKKDKGLFQKELSTETETDDRII